MIACKNKGTDKYVHPPSLVSHIVICCLEDIGFTHDIRQISTFLLISVAEQAGLSFNL